jgi:ribonuclease G
VNYELAISSQPNRVDIALLQDRQLVELHQETGDSGFQVGDLYFGRVQKVMPGLNAAFVNVGFTKDGFLHYLDLGPQVQSLMRFVDLTRSGKVKSPMLDRFRLEPGIEKGGKIGDVVKQGREILVQVAKEPISTKGPRLTTDLSLAGRYMVLVPFGEKVSVSQKIRENDEKRRLKELFDKIKPGGFGLIIRTAAEGKKVEDLESDLNELVKRWTDMINEVKTAQAPCRVMGELSRTSSIVRDMLSQEFSNIIVDTMEVYQEIHDYLSLSSPDKLKLLKLYKGKDPLFEALGLNRQIKASFGKNVTYKSGAYLVIEHTEALHVIDVNSGPRTNAEHDQETNALDCNLGAAKEIARQLRLRDMGGIIVVDFIDLHNPDNRKLLYNTLKEEMKTDRAKHNILPPSKFGLVQITRQRVRPEMDIKTLEKCPTCKGSGEVEATILFEEELENSVRYVLEQQNEQAITIKVHPYMGGYLTKGEFELLGFGMGNSVRKKWSAKYGKKITVETLSDYTLLEYHILDANGEEIRLD